MNDAQNTIVNEIVSKTTNDLILFFVLLLIAAVVFFLPYYNVKRKMNKDKNESELAEKQLLVEVIERNTNVISTLKATIDANNIAMTTLLSNLESTTEDLNKGVMKIYMNQETINAKIDEIISSNDDIKDDLKVIGTNYGMLVELQKDLEHVTNELKNLKT